MGLKASWRRIDATLSQLDVHVPMLESPRCFLGGYAPPALAVGAGG
jgi:hypothetical protein